MSSARPRAVGRTTLTLSIDSQSPSHLLGTLQRIGRRLNASSWGAMQCRVPTGSKLRCQAVEPPFQVCLVEPEIPPNTGSIARTCAATRTLLHLVEPLGFSLDERALRRAGLDYWHLVDVRVHPSFAAFEQARPPGALHLFSAGARRSYLDAPFEPGDCLVFGKESCGLPPDLLARHTERVWGIPTVGNVRSLNVSNAVSIVLYDALRRTGVLQRTVIETDPLK
jgi:tRNA (cytidine/uridine-2'-O-)-methyltransferase